MRTYFFIAATWILTLSLLSACDNTETFNPSLPELAPEALLSGVGECENQRETTAAAQEEPVTSISDSQTGAERLDQLQATVGADGKVSFTHTGALFNCCMDSVTLEIEVLGSVIRVVEVEQCPNPCFCTCEYTIYGEIVNLDPGSYTIEICGSMESTEPFCTATVTVN